MAPEQLNELLSTTYRPDLNLFVGRWGYQPATELLPRAYQYLTEKALAANCCFWLQDIRRRAFNDPHITQWLLTEYFPEMAVRLGGRLRVAYLTGPDLMETITTAPDFLLPSAYDTKTFVVAFFSNEGDAVQWLAQQQTQRLIG